LSRIRCLICRWLWRFPLPNARLLCPDALFQRQYPLPQTNTPAESKVEKIITNVQSILYWVDRSNPRGPIPLNPTSDPQFYLWNIGVQKWWEENKSKYNIITQADLPVNYENIHTEQNKPNLQIIGLPLEIKKTDKVSVTITNINNQFPLTKVDVFINNSYITTLSNQFRFVFNPSEYNYTPGLYKIKVVGTNNIYAVNQKEQDFTITQ
jgi:hypothetical protein